MMGFYVNEKKKKKKRRSLKFKRSYRRRKKDQNRVPKRGLSPVFTIGTVLVLRFLKTKPTNVIRKVSDEEIGFTD